MVELMMSMRLASPSTPDYEAQLRLNGALEVLRELEAELGKLHPLLPRTNSTSSWLLEVQFAIMEAVANVVRHAYLGQKGNIDVTLRGYPDCLQIDLYDAGEAFEPFEVQPLDFDPEDPPESGYGLPILYEVMDSVLYERSDGINHWRLIRKLPHL
jgi:anti-sigma regulatory factor (Ser/Thr protein kinase)